MKTGGVHDYLFVYLFACLKPFSIRSVKFSNPVKKSNMLVLIFQIIYFLTHFHDNHRSSNTSQRNIFLNRKNIKQTDW